MPKVKEILICWVHSKTCPKLRLLKTKEVLAWCYRQDQKAKINRHLHSKEKQFWRQSHPLFDVCNCAQNLNNWGQSFITSSTESELQTQKLGWSYLYLTVRVIMIIDPFSTLQHIPVMQKPWSILVWKTEVKEQCLKVTSYFIFIRNFTVSGIDSLQSSPKDSNYCIFKEVMPRGWEKGIFDLIKSLPGTHWTYLFSDVN